MPITCGPGVPARLSWASMYCMSSALTLCQSSANSSATSLTVAPAPPADKISKALGVERIVRQKVEPFPLHLATAVARDPPHLKFQKYPRVAARKIAHPPYRAVVPPHLDATATATSRFFERRLSVITRAFGSPKIPRTVCSGRKPGNEYVSQSHRFRFAAPAIHLRCQFPSSAEMQKTHAIHSFLNILTPKTPTRFREDPLR